jgi:hypothetical protein
MAVYYAINAGGNFFVAGTWSTTATKSAARTGGAVVPTNADTCYLDDWSGNVTVNTSSCTCKILDCVTNGNYTGTLTFTSTRTLTIATAGSILFSTTMTIAGTGTLALTGTVAFTTGGKTLTGALILQTSGTKTITGNLTVTGLTTSSATTQTINYVTSTDVLHLDGGLTLTGNMAGNMLLQLSGGTVSGAATLIMTSLVEIVGNVTFSGNTSMGGSIKYTSGTVTVTSHTLTVLGSMTGFDTDGMVWNTVLVSATPLVALNSDLRCVKFQLNAGFSTTTSHNIVCDNYVHNTGTLGLLGGATLIINNSAMLKGGATVQVKVYSRTASTDIYINYLGAVENFLCSGVDFTDVNASGSNTPLINWNHGVELRTTNILDGDPSMVFNKVSSSG